MNIQEYISSGVLESFLLGQLSPAEEEEVLAMAKEHPEIREELDKIAATFEALAVRTAAPPPIGLKRKIMHQIKPKERVRGSSSGQTGRKKPPASFNFNERNFLLGGLLLALVGFIVVAGILYYCKQNAATLQGQIDQMALTQDQISQDNTELTDRLDQALENLRIMSSEDYIKVDLQGLPLSPNSYAQVYWNPDSQEAFLRTTNLPTPASDRQYQLWAIVDGNPVSMGVFDLTPDSLIQMQSIDNAAAFAITLEPLGGVESPTLDQMHVIGEV